MFQAERADGLSVRIGARKAEGGAKKRTDWRIEAGFY
jgi:hypothetical protein